MHLRHTCEGGGAHHNSFTFTNFVFTCQLWFTNAQRCSCCATRIFGCLRKPNKVGSMSGTITSNQSTYNSPIFTESQNPSIVTSTHIYSNPISKMEKSVDEVFALFHDHGDHMYLGENVTQTSHMIQCAMHAEKDGQPPEVVLGALLHDIGNLVGHAAGAEKVIVKDVDIGPKDHDKQGEDFLKQRGFPLEIYCFAKGHVDAIRYMAFKDANYAKSLSWTSQETLKRKGGAMNAEEAAAFEKLPHHDAILKCRTWDEGAKQANVQLESLDKYKEMAKKYLAGKK